MISNNPEPFFNRGPSPLARLTFFSLIAIAIMIADHRFHALGTARLIVRTILDPIELLIAMPGNAALRVGSYFVNQDNLITENKELNNRVLTLAALGQQAGLIKTEHEHLTALLKSNSRFDDRGVIAEIIHDARNPFERKVILDKGLANGISAGLIAIDGEGVVGQVTSVGTFTSEITLLTEKNQSVPVMIVRNGLRMVAVGAGKEGTIDVPFIPTGADIQQSDILVTSGIDGTYPPGLNVAKVSAVEKNPALTFAKITAQPTSGVDSHRYVMVLSRINTASYPQPDIKEDEKKLGRDKLTHEKSGANRRRSSP